MSWLERYGHKCVPASEAIAQIPKGKSIFVASGAAEPVTLVHELVAQADRFADNTVRHLLTLGPAPYVDPRYESNFRHSAFFIGANVRDAVHEGRADYTPVFLSQIPDLIRARRIPIDVALIHVAPPDKFGYVNVGVSVDIVLAAIDAAKLVIAQVNENMPVIFGSGFVAADAIEFFVQADDPLLEHPPEPLDDVALEIGRNVATLVEDQSTVQVGIGQIPDAVLKALTAKRDLGVWTEMFSDGLLELIENGNITGRYKALHPNKISSSFTFGTRKLYDYVNRNPLFTFHPSDLINNPINVASQYKMIAINSALQVDLTGQVCADSIGTRFYSGIGGQVDFIRGASMCEGGKPIIALRSTARGGEISRICATLDPGAGVVTSRGDVNYVVTEYGIVDLQGKSVRERALALVGIAAPEFREELLSAANQRRYVVGVRRAPKTSYPKEYERRIQAGGDGFLLRPIRIQDEPKLSEFFYGLSDDTIFKRWMRELERLPREELENFLDVDYQDKLTLVVETQHPDAEAQIVGVARYQLDPATEDAQATVVVSDEWQGRGLGSALFDQLLAAARHNRVSALIADILTSNGPMLHVFHKSGLPLESERRGNIYRVKARLHPKRRRRNTGSLPSM
ncbi:MAG: GNAT family N-acetyltransferase [Deltaproteobacteria bacterium]|nr:GNAT family N-acetyltransferase [Deltaproteobacteria bacterium]